PGARRRHLLRRCGHRDPPVAALRARAGPHRGAGQAGHGSGARLRGERSGGGADGARVRLHRRPGRRRGGDRRRYRRGGTEAARGDLRRPGGAPARGPGACRPDRAGDGAVPGRTGPVHLVAAGRGGPPGGRGAAAPGRGRAGPGGCGGPAVRATATSLPDQLEALQRATDLAARVQQATGGSDQVLHRTVQEARGVITRARERTELSAEHTVVALAGATGSGKSSLLNLLAGAQVATVGARRPTTAHAQAVVCHGPHAQDEDAGPLLDWLGVSRRAAVRNDRLSSAVLVDLPDVDSLRRDHQLRAERLTERADVLVWVLDPQKYADAVVHQHYLRPMARHAEVMLVVLNQSDTLAPADLAPVLADLTERLAADGLPGVRVLPTSATTGSGTGDLVQAISAVVADRKNLHRRLAADLGTAAAHLAAACPPADVPGVGAQLRRRLAEELAAAAGADRVADAVATSYRMTARARTGWPV